MDSCDKELYLCEGPCKDISTKVLCVCVCMCVSLQSKGHTWEVKTFWLVQVQKFRIKCEGVKTEDDI